MRIIDSLRHLTKHTWNCFKRFFGDLRILAVWVPLALIVPNVALSLTEQVSPASALANIFLPLGLYLFIMGVWKRTGALTLLMLPFMIFAGFQIVLLYLYGGSVIAVDMFLNVVTTNVSEATELLANLVAAMAVVIVLYVPAIIWGICAVAKKEVLGKPFRRKLIRSAFVSGGFGAVMAGVAFLFCPGYNFVRETFPANAISNLAEACHRYQETSDHDRLAEGFTYRASGTHDEEKREIYLLVIGETARGANWQLGGYGRPNNPRLSSEEGVVFFPKSISESNTTHKSVPMLMSFACAENFDSIAYYRSVISAFKEAGFHTAFISNQQPNRSFTEHFGKEADKTLYISSTEGEQHSFDQDVFVPVDSLLADSSYAKQLIVIHTYGSHFKYRDRYPRSFARFTPDQTIDASPSNREELINAYDNTILYTDYILASLIDRLKAAGTRSALLYASDHGEDIFDDSRNRFLHASPQPTYWQIHQATLVWLSPALASADPVMAGSLKKNALKRISPQKSLFPTIMQLAGISSPYVTDSLSLVSPHYNPAPAVYLNDLNEALPLESCGLKKADMDILAPLLK